MKTTLIIKEKIHSPVRDQGIYHALNLIDERVIISADTDFEIKKKAEQIIKDYENISPFLKSTLAPVEAE